ncbi:hypothetical protein, partial [uncultured Duncaniella sp.]|uniref:hypothetical protein n=1 Tax=uncultured Duncaniella sp. TaxID=2768039 RepID=UPI00260DF4F2
GYVGKKFIYYWIFNLRGGDFSGIHLLLRFHNSFVCGCGRFEKRPYWASILGIKKSSAVGAADDCSIYTLYFRLYTILSII